MSTIKKINKFSGKYSFLSNFYPCIVEYEGKLYPSAEHAFQAAKTLDPEIRAEFAVFPTPADAKYFGRKIHLRDDWEDVKDDIMLKILESKFTRTQEFGPDLKALLLNTGDAELEEGNNHGDKYWGTVKGVGKNMLGISLMKIRNKIKPA